MAVKPSTSAGPSGSQTEKSPHKRAPSSWFVHLHAVVTSLQEVFRKGAPLCGDAGGIVPVGSKGAALRVRPLLRARPYLFVAPRAALAGAWFAPVSGPGPDGWLSRNVPGRGASWVYPAMLGLTVSRAVPRALESRYFGSVRHPLVLFRCFHRKQAAKGGQTCTA